VRSARPAAAGGAAHQASATIAHRRKAALGGINARGAKPHIKRASYRKREMARINRVYQ